MQHDEPISTSPPTSAPSSSSSSSSSPSPGPDPIIPAAESAEAVVATQEAPGSIIPPGRIWGFALIAGLVAGALSSGISEQVYETFKPGLVEEIVNGQKSMVPPPHEIAKATRLNGSLAFGIMGGLLGLTLGLAGGQAARQGPAGVRAGLIGLGVGVVATAVAAWAFIPAYYQYEFQLQMNEGGESLLIPLLVHAGIWGTAGAAGGLAFGLGLAKGQRNLAVRTLIGGLVGAVIGTVVYELASGLAFPMHKTTQPFADTLVPRVLAMMLTCVFAAAMVAFTVVDAQRARRSV